MNNIAGQAPANESRRAFIRFGLIGSAVVASGATLATVSGCASNTTPASGYRQLRDADLTLLRPLVPVLLVGAFDPTDDNIEHTLHGMDQLLDSAAPGAIADLHQLLDALQVAPMRRFFTGSWRHFGNQSTAELTETVTQWQQRNYELSRLSLRAISQPLLWAWYLTEEGARSTGYPGPPKKVLAA
ncbi:Tat pathway signal protein [Alcanivorax sp. JB21]|uniref:Tat pathway signal protein n=1 Tax=Alcanivorax limicola TaxID=2874102 RepID=UPI001CC050A1|nr:Tat pathway signal protein [Alcanivorax limicola]MBZ2189095.1 Tat pathway signal protein [Alcanivorax limicola]